MALLLKMFDQLRTSIHDMDASVATIVAVDHIYYFYWTQVKSLATRVEVCHLCRDRRSCKICTSCVNLPEKKRNFSHNLHRTTRFTNTKCDFALKLLKILHTQLNSYKKVY